jgi:hypothetical protein
MENKAKTRKVVVRNRRALAAIKESLASRATLAQKELEHARSTGLLEELLEANKKIAAQHKA